MTNELELYATDRPAWLDRIAPIAARKMASATDQQAQDTWSLMPDDYRKTVWQHLDETQRQRIRKLRSGR